MSESIKQSLSFQSAQEAIELRRLLEAAQTDLANLRAAVVGITAKLDADGGVTDADYASTWDPAALNLIP